MLSFLRKKKRAALPLAGCLLATLFLHAPALGYTVHPVLTPEGRPFVSLHIMDKGESSTAFGYPETATDNLDTDRIKALEKGILYWHSILGYGKNGTVPHIDLVPLQDEDDNASAYSPIPYDETSSLLASALMHGLAPEDAQEIMALITIDRASPHSEGWLTDKLPVLPLNAMQSDLPGTMLHEMFHALGLASYTMENTIADRGFWTQGLRDMFGNPTRMDMPIRESIEGITTSDANVFYMRSYADASSYGGAYFSGTHVDEVLNGALLIWPDDSDTSPVPGIPVNGFEGPDAELSHIELQGSLMSHQAYRNWCTLLEAEFAVLQDLGFELDRRQFFGYSIYGSGTEGTLAFTNNTNPYYARNAAGTGWLHGVPNPQDWGIGLHVYGSWNRVLQSADLLSSGDWGIGIRVDGVGNQIAIPGNVRIQADGASGNGLLVAYGRDHSIITQGNIQALGNEGVAVRFDFGSNELGDYIEYRGSYIRGEFDSDTLTWGNTAAPLLSALNGPLVRHLDVTGRLAGKAAAIYISSNALVEHIDIMRGAQLEGDIVSDWNASQPLYAGLSHQAPAGTRLVTELAFGRLPDENGRATGLPDTSFAMNYAGNITGPKGLWMHVAGGRLAFNGKADVLQMTIDANAVLGGNSTLAIDGGSGTLANAGTIAPGNSIGTITISGNYSQAPTGSLLMEVDGSGAHDVLNVTGNATLDGQISLAPMQDFYGAPMTLNLSSLVPVGGTLTNNLSSVQLAGDILSSPSLEMHLVPSPDNASFTLTPIRAAKAYSRYAETRNARKLGEALSQAAPAARGDLQNLFAAMDFSSGDGSAIRTGLAQMTTSAYASAALSSLALHRELTDFTLDELATDRSPAADTEWKAFARVYGGTRHQHAGNDMDGFKERHGGIIGGITRSTPDGLSLGAHVIAGARTLQGDVNGDYQGEHVALGGQARLAPDNWNGWNLFGIGRLGLETQRMQRDIQINGYNRQSRSDWTSFSTSLRVGVGYETTLGAASLFPFVALDYAGLFQPSLSEHNGEGARLHLDSTDFHSLRSVMGLRFETGAATFGSGHEVKAHLRAAWNHELLNKAGTTRTAFLDAPSVSFSQRTDFYGRDSVSISGGVSLVSPARNFALHANAGAEFGEYQGNDLYGGLSFVWKW